MRKAWFCPACNKHHAPHVETCPGPVDAVSPYRYVPNCTPEKFAITLVDGLGVDNKSFANCRDRFSNAIFASGPLELPGPDTF